MRDIAGHRWTPGARRLPARMRAIAGHPVAKRLEPMTPRQRASWRRGRVYGPPSCRTKAALRADSCGIETGGAEIRASNARRGRALQRQESPRPHGVVKLARRSGRKTKSNRRPATAAEVRPMGRACARTRLRPIAPPPSFAAPPRSAAPLELEPEEPTVIIEPDAMPPDLRALVAEVRRFLGSRNG